MIDKIFKKRAKKKQEIKTPAMGKITRETIEGHREAVLSEGRKFKYPLQYSKNKLVIHTIIISVISLFLIAFFFMWQLYIVQNSSSVFYRITTIFPLPVAVVDKQPVRFSNYLIRLRSEMHYLETKEDTDFSTKDGQNQAFLLKRNSMDESIADAYAAKLAKNKDIKVTKEQAKAYIEEQQNIGDSKVSEQTLATVLKELYGWTLADYEKVTQQKLLTQKVRYAVDDKARALGTEILAQLNKTGGSLEDEAQLFKNQGVTYGSSGGLVPKNNRDGGLAAAANKLEVNHLSGLVETALGDGFYIIKTLEKTDSEISYEYIKVPLTQFDSQLAKLRKEGKIREFIKIEGEEQDGSK